MNYQVRIIKSVVLGILALGILCFVLMLIWNALIPELFHGPVLSFPQAIGLFILSRILFGGRGGFKKLNFHKGDEQDMESFKSRSEYFRAKWAEKCGYAFRKEEDQVH